MRSDWPAAAYDVEDGDAALTIHTTEASLTLQKANGRMALARRDGTVLTQDAVVPWSDAERGFGSAFTLAESERLYGLGDVTRDRIQKRGFKTMMWVINVQSYVPIPYVMSDRGWALFLNTTWRHYIDLGQTDPDLFRFWGNEGELDYHLFVGSDYATLLDRYTDVAGKSHLLPLWGYALTFVSNQQANAREMLDDCLNLRREDIPCDVIGLEPGWMSSTMTFPSKRTGILNVFTSLTVQPRVHIPFWAPRSGWDSR